MLSNRGHQLTQFDITHYLPQPTTVLPLWILQPRDFALPKFGHLIMLCLIQSCKYHSKQPLQADKGQLTLRLPKASHASSCPWASQPSSRPRASASQPSSCPRTSPSQPSSHPKAIPSQPSSHRRLSQPSSHPRTSQPSSHPWTSQPSSHPRTSQPSSHPRTSQPSSRPRARESTSRPRWRWGKAMYRLWRTIWQQPIQRRMGHVHFLLQTAHEECPPMQHMAYVDMWIRWWY